MNVTNTLFDSPFHCESIFIIHVWWKMCSKYQKFTKSEMFTFSDKIESQNFPSKHSPRRGRSPSKQRCQLGNKSVRHPNRSFSLGVLCLGAEREAACVVCLDTPPKHRLLFFGADCTQITYLIGALLICVRSESSIQQALFRRGIHADDASRFSFCKYTEGKASIVIYHW